MQKCLLDSKALLKDFYVDVRLSDLDSLSIAIHMQKELRAISHIEGFKLRKWCANNRQLLQSIFSED